MTTSSCSSDLNNDHGRERDFRDITLRCLTRCWLPIQLATVLLLLATVVAGCSSDDGADPCELDELPLMDAIPEDAIAVSQMLIEARASYAADGTRTDTNLVRLTATDRTLGSIKSREPAACCGVTTCFLLTGRPAPQCREPSSGPCGTAPPCDSGETCIDDVCVACTAGPLSIKGASVSGLARAATLELDPVGNDGDKWTKAGLTGPLFDPANQLRLQVQGDQAEGSFASYEQTLESPHPLEMIEPDPTSAPQLPGQIDLKVKWKAGNGHWVEAVVQVDDPDRDVSDTAVCVAHDDGCMQIPASALDTITQGSPADSMVELSVRRVISNTQQPDNNDPNTVIQFKAVERVDMLLAP